jgi:hypothetical protein
VSDGSAPRPPRGLIVAFIAAEPGMAQRLLAEHRDDGTGHCQVCTAGPQAGRQVFPCRLRELAEEASKVTPGGQQ